MKKQFLGLMMGCCLSFSLAGQTDAPERYRNFPIVVTLQFHSLSLPFRDLKSNFSNIGLGLGTEVSLNGRHNWAQQFNVVWYRNKAVGNGWFFYTQSAWRPTIESGVFTELKIGAGYLLASRPVESYKQVDGSWVSVGRRGKGMFALPAGFSVGYHDFSPATYVSPFASYQLLVVKDYNKSIPLVPETLIQLGARINWKRPGSSPK
jgi:hypothetical protein